MHQARRACDQTRQELHATCEVSGRSSRRTGGQLDHEVSARQTIAVRIGPRSAAVSRGDRGNNREPEATAVPGRGAARRAAPEAIEHPKMGARVKACAGIDDVEAGTRRCCGDSYFYGSPLGRVFTHVRQQVRQYLT